jgi:thiol-disulfide isomerase/thioredoxin
MKRLVMIAIAATLGSGCEGDVALELADGRHARLEHWEGRFLVINYWAEWCAPCREEIPELNTLHAKRVATGAVVLGVNYDGLTGPALAEVAQRMKIGFPVLVEDPRTRFGYDMPQILPTTLIIGPDRTLRATLVGPQTEATIRKHLE